MTQPEETTAALIARLHEELKASKAECLQWRRDIDEERTVRQTHEGRSQSLHRALAKERSAFEAAESARIAWAERCIAIKILGTPGGR
jgi:capsule polysaccharide export protein KpsE/RkpR